MTRLRIEGLLLAFPKLIALDTSSSSSSSSSSSDKSSTKRGSLKQHTFVETDSVRYVYQPIEDLYILLITNKGSNIVEDLETLRLLSKIVPDVAGGSRESDITSKLFELIFAFDEVLAAGGYKEQVSSKMSMSMSMSTQKPNPPTHSPNYRA